MILAVLQQKLSSFPEDCFEEINDFLDLPSYKVKSSSSDVHPKMKVTPGLAEGKWKYLKDINAFDDVEDMFEIYL